MKIDELSTVIDKSNCFLSLDAMDFRLDFEFELCKMEMDAEKIYLFKEMIKKLSENINVFRVYAPLSVLKCGTQLSQTKFAVVRETINKCNFIYAIFSRKFMITVIRQIHTTLMNYH